MNYSFDALEFNKITPLLDKYIKTYAGKIEIENIRKVIEEGSPENELKLTEQMTNFLKFDSNISFEEIGNIEEPVENSKIKGYALSIEDILEIKKALGIFRDIYDVLCPFAVKYSLVFSMMKDILFPAGLLNEINIAMDDNGTVKDSASIELKRIRKRKSSVRIEIHAALSSLMEKKSFRDTVQDKIITLREGRFVIPVKSQSKNTIKPELKYIIHSFSNTGGTIFVEPEIVIPLNNEMMEIDGLEWAEINKILLKITGLVNDNSAEILSIFNIIGKLELLYSKARFAIEYRCNFPEIIMDRPFIRLRKAYHPLLGSNSVPIDIEVGSSCQGLIISGPNSGGKTVALKTAGLCTLMALCGIPIPADTSSQIGFFKKILAEIGDEQSISENLSSFSGHIVSISRMLGACDDSSLVLIDEIASSTEPKEGEALGKAIILSLIEKRAKFVITTHYHALKEIAYNDKRVKNASVDFDEEKLIPLYTLKTGTSGSSYAFRIAKKYGLSTGVVEAAESYLKEKYSSAETLLKAIELEKNDLDKKRGIIETNISESRIIKSRYENLLKNLEEEKLSLQKKGLGHLRKELDDALQEISALKSSLKLKTKESLVKAGKDIKEVEKVLKKSEDEILRGERKRPDGIAPGRNVYVGGFNKEGYIEQVLGDKVRVRLGIISTIVGLDDIYKSDKDEVSGGRAPKISLSGSPVLLVIDVRGKNAEEALKIVEKNIDLAFIKGVPGISIIHGKGEGILRREIWNFLQKQDSIKNFNYARPEDGGQGKTIVTFK